MKKILHIIIPFFLLIAVWWIVGAVNQFNPSLFPTPKGVWFAFLEMLREPGFFENIKDSMIRFFSGYLTAGVAAVILGLLLGWFQKAWAFVNPVVQLLRPISPMAWMPFIVLFFGIGDLPAIVIIFLSAFFPVLLSTVSGVKNIDPVYLKVSKNYGVGQPQVLLKVVFPSAFPKIMTGLRLAIGTAWIFLVAGEMAGSQSGLGYLIIDARNNLRNDMLMADILIIGLIGILLDALAGLAERRILKFWGIEGKAGEA